MSHSVPADADPRLFWNGQYLLEDDPNDPSKYSKAAEEAQRAKWLALMANRAPSKTLSRELIAKNGSKPPLYHYGIPFTDQYMLEYAKRHHLTVKLLPGAMKFFGGKPEFAFEDISREDEEDEVFMSQLLSAGCSAAVRHIGDRCDIPLHLARPFSLHWDGMVSLWSNYDINERSLTWIRSRERCENIMAKLKEAMYEGGEENEIEWWYEWNNDVGIFTSLA
ncbi:hypothetical protein GSI_08878 [Ganoderma sinense ZZ0214-1]|uniref:Uncharacterized protein n=1 Tax=Ganoderma sinense ZZ0214-1 TaxID=1077348 RepID=A0A2G8S4X8_9APHY|nr:hypothetical protein GSI_08878 [Ganoderma sinense ZZ0214-1]